MNIFPVLTVTRYTIYVWVPAGCTLVRAPYLGNPQPEAAVSLESSDASTVGRIAVRSVAIVCPRQQPLRDVQRPCHAVRQ